MLKNHQNYRMFSVPINSKKLSSKAMVEHLICPLIEQRSNRIIPPINNQQQGRNFCSSEIKKTTFLLVHKFLQYVCIQHETEVPVLRVANI